MYMSLNPEMTMRVEETLESFVKGAVAEVGSIYKFYELANKQGINPLEKRTALREDIMVDEILQANVYSRVLVTPKSIRKYYKDHIADFSKEGKLSFRQIMIKYSSYDTRDEARAVVDGLLSRLKDGEGFADIATNNSKGPHAEEGGLWESDEVRDFRKDFLKVISNLKKDEISEIIKSSIGYHIFKVEEMESEQTSSFQDAQDQIYKIIFRDLYVDKKKEYLKELRKDATIERYN